MIKSISFIVLTQFFHFNELKILKAARLLNFFKYNQQLCMGLFLTISGVQHAMLDPTDS